jgi:hypothetical protein
MTCTVSVSLPTLAIVAADTRFNLLDNGNWQRLDARLGSYEVRSGRSFPIPDGCRKIRRVGDTWAVSTGDAVTGELIFERLQSRDLYDGTLLPEWDRQRDSVRASSHAESGFLLEEIDKSRVMIAVRGPASTITTLAISEGSQAQSGQYVITWPPAITPAESDEKGGVFRAELQQAVTTSDLYGVIRAVIKVIKFASDRCETVGPIVQLGFAIGPREQTQHFRIEGNVNELLGLDNAGLQARLIVVA